MNQQVSRLYVEILSARRARDAAKGTAQFQAANARVAALYQAVAVAKVQS